MRKLLLAGTAALLLSGTAASAQNYDPPDPDNYYSQNDQNGYYDRTGRYHRFDENDNSYGDDNAAPPPPPSGYYREGAYEDSCRRGNSTVGTLFGALAGGLIGNAAGRGNGGAVIGGAILGGLLGNAVARDMPCEDHPHAFRAYSAGLNGELGRRYEWRNGDDYGYFTPEREFPRGRTICRSWTETTYARGRSFTRTGTACRRSDGNWHFDD